ncbi:MAG: bifunctional GNAT family N-acetyltransferase/hotdog fold thioesterase [Calditrichaceae bacterium]
MKITHSKIESERFKINVHRGSFENFRPSELKKYIIENTVDLLILRLPSKNKVYQEKLEKLGFDSIHADSLVYYSKDLTKSDIQKPQNQLDFEVVTQDNQRFFDEIIPVIFKDYQNHYFSNPFLNPTDINDGYVEWAKNYVANDNNRIAWYVKSEDRIAGFATCSFDPLIMECEGVLYGVMPGFEGKGIYSDIMRFTQDYFKKLGYKKMLVSTQIQNYAVQKVWVRENFFLTHSFETYHINSMLEYSVNEKKVFKIEITKKELNEFAEYSGDYNSVHFDAEYARSLGFEDRIVHGMIIQAKLSKIFGTDYPGQGTLFMSNKNLFIKPMYLGVEYSIIISTTKIDQNGVIQVLAKILDSSSNLCLLSYNYLVKR